MKQTEKAAKLSEFLCRLSGDEMRMLDAMSPDELHEFLRRIKLRWEEDQRKK